MMDSPVKKAFEFTKDEKPELLEAYQKLCQAAGLKLLAVTPRTLGSVATLQALAGTTPLTPVVPPNTSVALLTLSTATVAPPWRVTV